MKHPRPNPKETLEAVEGLQKAQLYFTLLARHFAERYEGDKAGLVDALAKDRANLNNIVRNWFDAFSTPSTPLPMCEPEKDSYIHGPSIIVFL